jgi:predicted phosphodiesterase
MKITILSDVHANFYALEAVLAQAPAHDALLCLGDIVGYGVQPNECCELLRERGAHCLAGNHDAALVGHELIERMNALAQFSNDWTRAELSPENRAWLASLSPHLAFEEWGFEAVRASLDSPLEGYINGIYSARPTWSRMKFDLCFFGHTHVAASLAELNVPGRKLEVEERKWRDGGRFLIQANGWKTLVNPGSVGQPRDGNPLSRFAVFDSASREVEIICVRYNVEAAHNAVIEAGFPRKISERLALGR